MFEETEFEITKGKILLFGGRLTINIPNFEFKLTEPKKKKEIIIHYIDELENDYHYDTKKGNRKGNRKHRGLF